MNIYGGGQDGTCKKKEKRRRGGDEWRGMMMLGSTQNMPECNDLYHEDAHDDEHMQNNTKHNATYDEAMMQQ